MILGKNAPDCHLNRSGMTTSAAFQVMAGRCGCFHFKRSMSDAFGGQFPFQVSLDIFHAAQIGNDNMRSEGGLGSAYRPDMQMVDAFHTWSPGHDRHDFVRVNASRHCIYGHSETFGEKPVCGNEYYDRDKQPYYRVDDRKSGQGNDYPGYHNPGRDKSIRNHVEKGSFCIDVMLLLFHKHEGRYPVHQDSCRSSPGDGRSVYVHRFIELPDTFHYYRPYCNQKYD